MTHISVVCGGSGFVCVLSDEVRACTVMCMLQIVAFVLLTEQVRALWW